MPEKPPDAKKPEADCRRVLRVSSGKRLRSTVVPAMAPARRAVRKVGWGAVGGGGGEAEELAGEVMFAVVSGSLAMVAVLGATTGCVTLLKVVVATEAPMNVPVRP
jgi:hypothetical protein